MYVPLYNNVDTGGFAMGGLGGGCEHGGGAFGSSVSAALQFFAAAQCLLTDDWPTNANITNGTSFDFIVVGGGTAGAALAARLSEIESFSVLLLEAGDDPPQESQVPLFKDALKNSKYDWNFTTVSDGFSGQALQNGSQKQPRGKLLGGSGSMNDMVYARGFPADYREWATFLGPEWNWTTVLEYFKKSEDITDERIVNNPELMQYHGRGGPIRVTGFNESTFTIDKFLEAFEELGYNNVQDMTYPHLLGVGRFSHTIREGRRDSSVTGLLNEASRRNNLSVIKNFKVTKLIMDNKTVRGIKGLSSNGKELHFFANYEVIISAGTFNTPKLLMLSGIGPAEHLNAMGIETVVNLPVGHNLHDHVMVPLYLAANNGTCVVDEAHNHMQTIRYLFDHTGSLSSTNSMGAYYTLKSSEDENVPDFGIYPTCIPVGSAFEQGCMSVLGYKSSICQQLGAANAEKELLSLVVVLLKPTSRGSVLLTSTDPLEYPTIYSGTFSDERDLKGFPEAMLSAISVGATSYFKSREAQFLKLDIEECSRSRGRYYLECYARTMVTAAWHAVGTAAMGSVLDPQFKVYGVNGVRVVDASAMPKVIRANTNAPVVMFAERAAEFIKKDYSQIH